MAVVLTNFFLHLHPVSIRTQALALSYSWCMGGITFFLFLVETVTGVLLMFYYRPTFEWAYNDMLALRDVTSLGILRELHRWGAPRDGDRRHAAHVPRVPDGQLQAAAGVQLGDRCGPAGADAPAVVHRLPPACGPVGDVGHHRGIQHGTGHTAAGTRGPGAALLTVDGIDMITNASDVRFGLLGARFVGEATLNRFYVFHCVAIPVAAALLMAIHFWRVRKDGGISGPL